MRDRRLPLAVIKWTASFLSERKTAVCLDGILHEMKPVETGIPQGSSISPPLSALLTAPLLDMFNNTANEQARTRAALRFPNNQPSPVSLRMYVDDGLLHVASQSHETNSTLLAEAYQKVDEWAQSTGIILDEGDKREVMHFTHRRRIDPALLPPVFIPNRDGSNTETAPLQRLRWLGIIFDPKLSFKNHVELMATKAMRALNLIKMLANSVRGLHQTFLRTLYVACCRSILSYGAPVWWKGKPSSIASCNKVQAAALRWICGAFRTTPTRALEIDAAIPPLDLFLDYSLERAAHRLNKITQSNLLIQRLGNEWRNGHDPYILPPIPVRPSLLASHNDRTDQARRNRPPLSTLYQIARMTAHIHERLDPLALPPWHRSFLHPDYVRRLIWKPYRRESKEALVALHKEEVNKLRDNPEHLVVYTDASLIEGAEGKRGCGIGILISHGGRTLPGYPKAISITPESEVWDAELYAIAFAARTSVALCLSSLPDVKHIHIFSDNTSAIQVCYLGNAKAGQASSLNTRDAAFEFLDRHPANTFNVKYCPGHSSIPGNDSVDTEAKSAARPHVFIPGRATLTYLKRLAKTRLIQKWTERWHNTPPTGFSAPADRLAPSSHPAPHFVALGRKLYSRVTQCRTGHAFTGDYYRRFVPTEDPSCECEDTLRTRAHILQDCPLYSEERAHLHLNRQNPYIPALADLLGTRKGIDATACFIQATGAFDKSRPI